MTPRLSIFILALFACVPALAQQPEPLPAAPAPTPLILPKPGGSIPPFSSGRVLADSDHKPPPPPAPDDEAAWCTVPSDVLRQPPRPAGEHTVNTAELIQYVSWRSATPIRESVEFEWSKYIAAYYRQTFHHMKLPPFNHVKENTKVQIRFNLQQDGTVTDAAIMMSSGRKPYDKAALDSLLKASPYNPLPDGVTGPITLCSVFNFNPYAQHAMPDDPFATKPAQP